MFKKALVTLKSGFFALPMYFSSLHVKKHGFAIVYETARLWALMFLKFAQVKVKVHHKNYIPLKEGVLFVCLSQSSIDQEIILSAISSPSVFYLNKEKRLFLVSNAWQKRLKSVNYPKLLDEKIFKDNQNIVVFVDHYDKINESLINHVIKYDYPIVLLDIVNAHRALDEKPLKRVVVDVMFNIPIVSEEYSGLSLNQLKHLMIERKEGNMYEHD
jgi:hypothetical protein